MRLTGLWRKEGRKTVTLREVSKKTSLKPFISEKLIFEANARAKEIILEAKEEALKIKNQAEELLESNRIKTQQIQQQLLQKSTEIDRKLGILEEKTRNLNKREQILERKEEEIERIKKQQLDRLEKISLLKKEEARKLILDAWEKKISTEIGQRIKEAEEEAKQIADNKAREILVEAMQRGATDYVPEYTVSVVKLPDEEMKGRIIGREGRNIRTFEKVTGVDTDLDEEGVIRLSSFDSIRREIARVALERLIADGRIQPVRIEEIVEKTKKDLDRIIRQSGEELCHRLKVYNLPREVIDMLGRFRYRFSYGQNMISHTLEETKIGVALAYEIGANTNIVRLGCLLHDIGKVITEEEGSHVKIGADFLRKHNIPQPVLDCVLQHHGDEEFSSIESVLVYIADAISSSRPGARYEDYEEYIARLKNLESLALSFEGVEQAYALQAGREIRVIVNPKEKNDNEMMKLAADLKEKIKKETNVPGQVKITVIRETRATEVV